MPYAMHKCDYEECAALSNGLVTKKQMEECVTITSMLLGNMVGTTIRDEDDKITGFCLAVYNRTIIEVVQIHGDDDSVSALIVDVLNMVKAEHGLYNQLNVIVAERDNEHLYTVKRVLASMDAMSTMTEMSYFEDGSDAVVFESWDWSLKPEMTGLSGFKGVSMGRSIKDVLNDSVYDTFRLPKGNEAFDVDFNADAFDGEVEEFDEDDFEDFNPETFGDGV